jgi:hypothetical protein
MTSGTKLPVRRIVLGGMALLVIAVLLGGGFGNALAIAGLIALLVGGVAAITGRAQWAGIATRKTAGVVAAAGLVALVAGANIATPTQPTSSSEAAEESPAPASPTDEAAIEAAEESLTKAETDESPTPEDDGVDLGTGLLSDTAADEAVDAAKPTTALAALAAIEVKGRAPRTGYDRDQFGSGWVDVDNNGCDTRNDILARDLTGETFKPGTQDCVVLTGTAPSPIRTPGARLPSSAARTPAMTSRSTTSSPCPTPGRRAPRASTPLSARPSLTTR